MITSNSSINKDIYLGGNESLDFRQVDNDRSRNVGHFRIDPFPANLQAAILEVVADKIPSKQLLIVQNITTINVQTVN